MNDVVDTRTNVDEPLVFISYTAADRQRVSPYYDFLDSRGYNVWMDIRKLKAGQQWKFEIDKNLNKASLIIIFISNNSVDKRGYVQRELRDALDKAKEKLDDDIYIIPVLLDENAAIPAALSDIQYIRDSDGNSHNTVKESIDFQFSKMNKRVEQYQESKHIRWSKVVKKEEWEGLPGYEARFETLLLSSPEYPNIFEISEILKSEAIKLLMEQRSVMLKQTPELRNFGQEKFWRTNTLDVTCADPVVVGKTITIFTEVYRMNGGAAHPYSYPQAFAFLLHPLVYIKQLHELFIDPNAAFPLIQQLIRQQLLSLRFGESDEEALLDPSWVEKGTSKWEDFEIFTFREDGIMVHFAPYHVSAYVFGSHSCFIDFNMIVDMLTPALRSALGIEYFNRTSPPRTVYQPD